MRVVIVDREPAFLAPLIEDLEREGFEVTVVENISGVLSYIKKQRLHFLVADSALLVDHSMGAEVRRQSPLTRLIVLAARPSLLAMIKSISGGMTDYLPRDQASFGQLLDTILDERNRLVRWQFTILSESLGARTGVSSAERKPPGGEVAVDGGPAA
ncbi:MAG: response regulator [Deltaproteobacteria bacterium]|jgi:DNA-binding response OmpR family regulator|nr:response regulator [Deltaproteobacteria bacterium]